MTINLQKPDIRELKPKITVFGVGGGGGNAVNNMINGGLEGVDFVCANTDAQALTMSKAEKIIQLGHGATQGLGAGSQPEVGRQAAEECLDEIQDYLQGTHMAFVTAGMGGGTGTGAAPVVARAARELGILTVGVVTKPFQFEGQRRMRTAEDGILELQKNVDTLIVIPNQNLFRIANDKTTFADAFGMADQVLYSGVSCITDLMVKEGLINLDFADVRSVMREMGKAMMGTGEASGDGRAMQAAEAAISNPLLDETSMRGAQGLLISITGGRDMTLFEVDEAATRIREEVDSEANIIVGATFDESLDGIFRVSVVATGIDNSAMTAKPVVQPGRTEAIARPAVMAQKPATPQAAPASQPIAMGIPQKPAAPVASPAASRPAQPMPAPAAVEKNGVKIEPLKRSAEPNPREMEDEFRDALEAELMPRETTFVPPAAQRPDRPVAAQRVPQVEDFPAIARTATEAPRAAQTEQKREGSPMSLLQKLKTGFGVREEHHNPAPAERAEPARAEMPVRAQPQPQPVPAPQPRPAVAAQAADNPYAPKGNLDQTGRPTSPQPRSLHDDDELEIPAFLRRQAN
ncbi:MAG: cell division protein FtsZ [Nitratireductor sp.]|nr:cell division protein FtsZ [Nitratireductor sp.]